MFIYFTLVCTFSPVVMRKSYRTKLGHGSKMVRNTGCTLSPIQLLLDFLVAKDES